MTDAPPNQHDGMAITDRWIISASMVGVRTQRSAVVNHAGTEFLPAPAATELELVSISFDSSPAGLAFSSTLPPHAAIAALSAIVASIASQVSQHEGEHI